MVEGETGGNKMGEEYVLYGVSPVIQDELITKHCFGDCGKILFAGADGGPEIGAVCLCKHDDCPHEDKCTPVLGDIRGEEFKMRKLK